LTDDVQDEEANTRLEARKRTRGAKREKKENNLILTDDMHNEEAGTRREARKKKFFILTEGAGTAKARARGAKREIFFFPLLSL
jgi:hypothetical protein